MKMVYEWFMNNLETVHKIVQELIKLINWVFMKNLAHELPFVVHRLFMKIINGS